MDKSGGRRKSAIKQLSPFEKFRQNVRIQLLLIFYKKPLAGPVSRSLVCNNYTNVIELIALIVCIVAITALKNTQMIIMLVAISVAFVVPSFVTRLGINATYYKIICIWRIIVLPLGVIIIVFLSKYYQALVQVCNALEHYDSSIITQESLDLCSDLRNRYIILFSVVSFVLFTRLVNILFFFKGFQHLQRILMEKRLKKKRKLRYSNVQRRKELMKKEGYYTYNQNRKL